MKGRRPREAPLLTAAEELLAGVEELERLSAKVAELNLPTWKAVVRAGDLLNEAVSAHQRFASALTDLSERVGALRDRHNRAADVLAEQANRVDARRVSHQAFEERFAVLAASARETDALLKAIPAGTPDDPAAHLAAVAAGLGAVREHLARARDEARTLAVDADTAGFVDLRQQAEQVGSQLDAMLRQATAAAP